MLSASTADSTSGGRGGGGADIIFQPNSINEVSALSADSTSGRWMLSAFSHFRARMYGNFYFGEGGRHSIPKPPPPPYLISVQRKQMYCLFHATRLLRC